MSSQPPPGWEIRELWKEYEAVAMHFNDLLMRIRTQALGGVAALATLTGIFANPGMGDMRANWEVAMFMFAGLALLWIAIWVLDFMYYNKLLLGAVVALLELEEESKTKTHIMPIQLSTIVEAIV